MSRATKSSPEHVTDCLRGIAKVIKPKWKREDVDAGLAAYVEVLVAYDPQAVRYACERWVETKRAWPAVSDLVAMIRSSSRATAEASDEPRHVDGATYRNEAIQLLGTYHFRAKDLVTEADDYRNFLAEAGRLWRRLRPAGGLDEVDRTRGSRRTFGFALEAWARRYLDDDPVHVAYATDGVRQAFQQLTGDDLLTMGEMPDLTDTVDLRRMAA